MFTSENAKRFLSENYLLLIILVGTILVTFSIGPYQNLDSTKEFQAANAVLTWGKPYVQVGYVIDEPPVGFYVEALFFKAFGDSIGVGTVLITLFGFGCTILAYMVGKELYGKRTGLFAAALFGLSPWELILSRSFLEDTICLFLSMLCLLVGIVAIRRKSVGMAAVTGVLFAAAFLTKFYAAFMLIPLFSLYVYSQPKNLKRVIGQTLGFSLPTLVAMYLWYQIILKTPILLAFRHTDFGSLNAAGTAPTPFFISDFLLKYALSSFFVAAAAFSVLAAFLMRKWLPKTLIYDFTWLITIAVVLGVNVALGIGLNLKVPYTSAIKYSYQALPFFCLLAASLAGKAFSLYRTKINRTLVYVIALAVAVLLGLTFVSEAFSAHQMAASDYIVCQVTPAQTNVGYSFFRYTPLSQYGFLMDLQYLGYAVLLSGLLWISWRLIVKFFVALFKPMHLWISKKNSETRQGSSNP